MNEATNSPDSIVAVHVVKANSTINVDTAALPDAVYREVIAQGLKIIVNRGTTKITKETYPDEAQRSEAAMEAAQHQVDEMLAGKVKRSAGVKAGKGASDTKVMTEARRIARNMIKDQMRANGLKVSQYDASTITEAANALMAKQPAILEEARASLERHAKPAQVELDLKSLPVSDKKAAEAAKRKAEKATQLSAKQAGKPKTGHSEASPAH